MTANDFRGTDFGKRCEYWLLRSLEEEGPILFSTLGQGHFLPQGVDVRDWVLSIPWVVPYLGLGPNNYCESSKCPSDSRERRRSPVIIPEWMRNGGFPSERKRNGIGGIQLLVAFLRRMKDFILSNRPISREKWNNVVRTLSADKRQTVFVKYLKGQESFTASKFLSGDGEAILVRSRGGNVEVKRREVADLRLMRANRFQQVGIGRVKKWYQKDLQIGYGFIVDDDLNETFFFETRRIFDSSLVKSLSMGKYGQMVRYQIVKEKVGDKLAIVQVLELLKDYVGDCGADDQFYREGHRAMIQGDLKKAEDLLRQALASPTTTRKISALKDLAETFNRLKKTDEAIKLIEEYRGSFSSDEWESFERMEIGYLERLGEIEKALSKVKNLLKKARDMEPGQREHYEKKLDVLREKLKSQNDGAMSGVENTDRRVDAKKAAQEENMAEMLRKKRFDEATLRQLADFAIESNQHDTIVLRKIEDFRRTSGWTSRSMISKMVRNELEATSFPDEIANAIGDVLDLELIRQASERPELELVKPEFIAREGVNTQDFGIRLCKQSDVPLKNLRIDLDPDHKIEVAKCANLSYEDGLKKIPIKFKTQPREEQVGRGSIRYDISYEKDLDNEQELDNDILSKMDEDAKRGCIEGRFEFYLGENGFSAIKPNPYERFCNHDAKGEFFVGREECLERLAENLSSREGGQAYLLHGQPKMGKTSIRKNLHGKLLERLNGSLLYTSLSIKDWGRGAVGDRKKSEPLKWLTFDIVMDVIEGYLRPQGKWTTDMERVFEKIEDEATDYAAAKLKYIGRILKNMGVVWVVVIDEFTDLYDLLQRCGHDKKDVFDNMLGLMDVLKTRLEDGSFNLLLIGLESMSQFIKEMRNPFHVIKDERLSYLSDPATVDLLAKPLADRLYPDRDALAQYCLLTGGYPLYAMYFCRDVVRYATEHRFSIIKREDVDAIAESICNGPKRWRPDEFDPFFQIGIREYNGRPLDEQVLAELYYEVAGTGTEDAACPLDVFNNRERHKAMFEFLLKERDLFVQNPNGTVMFKVGIFAKYLQANPDLSITDFRKQL